MNKKYYQMTVTGTSADLNIYGDITSWPWLDTDVSAFDIKQEIDALNVDEINVFINSYGGEVAEAIAINSALTRNKAKVKTYCDGFACSAATIIFAAGDERIMGELGLLMIHNCMSYVGYANSEELRKAADDNDKINSASITSYMKIVNVSEEEIKNLMDNESWITAQEALDMGFATSIASKDENGQPSQSAQQMVRNRILNSGSVLEVKTGNALDGNQAVNQKLDQILTMLQKKEDDDDPDDTGDGTGDDDDPDDTGDGTGKDDNPDDTGDGTGDDDDPDDEDEKDNEKQSSQAKEHLIAFFNALSK